MSAQQKVTDQTISYISLSDIKIWYSQHGFIISCISPTNFELQDRSNLWPTVMDDQFRFFSLKLALGGTASGWFHYSRSDTVTSQSNQFSVWLTRQFNPIDSISRTNVGLSEGPSNQTNDYPGVLDMTRSFREGERIIHFQFFRHILHGHKYVDTWTWVDWTSHVTLPMILNTLNWVRN